MFTASQKRKTVLKFKMDEASQEHHEHQKYGWCSGVGEGRSIRASTFVKVLFLVISRQPNNAELGKKVRTFRLFLDLTPKAGR